MRRAELPEGRMMGVHIEQGSPLSYGLIGYISATFNAKKSMGNQ
jgi:hypothetical protein